MAKCVVPNINTPSTAPMITMIPLCIVYNVCRTFSAASTAQNKKNKVAGTRSTFFAQGSSYAVTLGDRDDANPKGHVGVSFRQDILSKISPNLQSLTLPNM